MSHSTFSESPQDDYDFAWYAARPRRLFDAHALVLALTLIGIAAMGWGYLYTLKPVTLQIDEQTRTVLSNQTTVAGVLNDAGVSLAPEDQVFPALDAPVPGDQPIAVHLAKLIQLQADGDRLAFRTQENTVGAALQQASIAVKPQDRILLDGRGVEPSVALAEPELGSPAQQIEIQRAVPIQINDNGALSTFYTTAPTLGEALRQAGLVVYLGDAVTPNLGTPVQPGWQVYIERSRAATIHVDGKVIHTRTLGSSITDLLKQEGVTLAGKDYSIPAATEATRDGMDVQVMRVKEDFITETEAIPFDTKWQADASLVLDQHVVVQTGAEGVKKRTIRIDYENGREVSRTIDKEWIEAAPVTKIISYGTNIVHNTMTLPNGQTISYWRTIRVLATSYTAASSGKARTHPEFGITYLGLHAGLGIVAVDPKLINLRATMYVPGYGLALAGDTGGRIKGRRVDLGYDESDLVLWFKWVNVYLIDPPPPADQINWILPDLPRNSQ